MASNPIDYNSLSAQERLRLIEAIWDTFCEEPESLPFTEEQREELDRRLDALEGKESIQVITWAEVREGLHHDRTSTRWRDRT
jgi:putative addiction module component (TIGR02574 family)